MKNSKNFVLPRPFTDRLGALFLESFHLYAMKQDQFGSFRRMDLACINLSEASSELKQLSVYRNIPYAC